MMASISWLKRNGRGIAVVAVLFLIIWLLVELRRVLLPFALGLLIAWLLQPVVDCVERWIPGVKSHHLRRVVSIVVIYLVVTAVIGLVVFWMVTVLGRSLVALLAAAPELVPQGIEALETWLESFLTTLPPSTRAQLDALLAEAGTRASQALVSFITGGVVRIGSSSNMILGFVALPVFLFYLLKDWARLREELYSSLPHWVAIHARNVAAIVHDVVGRYLRGQLILGIVVGLAVYLLLKIAGIPYAAPLAVFGGIAELVPVIGPWLAGIAGVLVVLATSPEKTLWVGIGYILIQLLENNLLVPRIQGRQMQIHPALVIVLTIVAASRFGIVGFLLVLPLTMFAVRLVRYVRIQMRTSPDEAGR